jgi:hypothetical protein
LIPDSLAIVFSAITAYNFRFPEAGAGIEATPAIAQFDYRGVMTALVVAWVGVLISTGTYRANHANLVVFYLSIIIKR